MTLRSRIPLALAVVAASLGLLLGGCVSAPNVDLDAAHKAGIKRVALLGIPEPAPVQLANLGGAASAFGLIGGLVQAGTNADHTKEFTAALHRDQVTFAPPLAAAITGALKGDGFEVVDAHDQRPKLAADGKSDDFSDVHVDADAFLAVWYGTFGYISQPMSTTYEPWVLIKARLLDARTKKDLYFKTFIVGWKMKIKDAVYLPADPQYHYKSYDAVMAHVADAAKGLLDAQARVASQIGADLRRSP